MSVAVAGAEWPHAVYGLEVVYSTEMADNAFWRTILEDLRAPIRDHVRQIFYLVLVGLLEVSLRLFDLGPSWLEEIISTVFHGLTLIALGNLTIPMALRMVIDMVRSCIKAVREP